MQIDLVILPMMFLLGIGAAVFGVIYVVGRIVGGIGRGVGSLFAQPHHRDSVSRPSAKGFRICWRQHCRRMEYRDAVYCSQCGARLSGTGSVSDVRYE